MNWHLMQATELAPIIVALIILLYGLVHSFDKDKRPITTIQRRQSNAGLYPNLKRNGE